MTKISELCFSSICTGNCELGSRSVCGRKMLHHRKLLIYCFIYVQIAKELWLILMSVVLWNRNCVFQFYNCHICFHFVISSYGFEINIVYKHLHTCIYMYSVYIYIYIIIYHHFHTNHTFIQSQAINIVITVPKVEYNRCFELPKGNPHLAFLVSIARMFDIQSWPGCNDTILNIRQGPLLLTWINCNSSTIITL